MEYFGFNSPQFYSAYTKSELSMFYRPVSGVIPLIHPIGSQCNSDCIFYLSSANTRILAF